MPAIRPFQIEVSESVITDLRDRLARARFLPDSPNKPASGMSAGYLTELADSWQTFDWREREAWLNNHSQYTVDIDDCELHFVHLRSEREDAPVIIVMHGWPHTFAMQLDFADQLQDFHVVVPSLPGFAFSSAYRTGVWSTERVTATMHRLMTEVLGYSQFLTYGEDVSAYINDLLAAKYPENILGIIATHAHFPSDEERKEFTDPDVLVFFQGLADEARDASGYAHEQGTRPDTLAAGLNDSPVGLLAWIGEKFVEWSDTSAGDPRDVEQRISRERILTEAMIYWTTESIATSFAPYFEDDGYPAGYPSVSVPASVHIQRHEADYPEVLAQNYYLDLRTFDRLSEGGHFAIAEVPAAMAQRVRAFASELGLL